ncbi:MAG: PilZ domain-containing protein [Lysobacter sp.]
MSAENANDEYRRVPRRKIAETIQVVDTMTDNVIGRLGNLSETGMLVITSMPLVDDALYQLRFSLHDTTSVPIEVGVHLLWQDTASASGQTWTGFRFITLLDSQMLQLRQWLDSPGGRYE